MFIVNQRVRVKKGDEAAFVSAINSREKIKEQEGFVDLTICKSTVDDSTFLLIGRWESSEAHNAWENTPARKEASDNNQAEVLEVYTGTYEVLGMV